MHISKIRVQNYKAFYDSGWIEFQPGINIISGQNHSGKTALLEALSLNFENMPHRSFKTLPTIFERLTTNSQVELAIVVTKKDFLEFIRREEFNGREKNLIMPDALGTIDKDAVFGKLIAELNSLDNNIEIVLPFDAVGINVTRFKNEIHNLSFLTLYTYNPKFQGHSSTIEGLKWSTNPKVKGSKYQKVVLKQINELTLVKFFLTKKETIYRFFAERKNVGICEFGSKLELKPDASNLAEVINCLQCRFPRKFSQFNKLVSIVLPHIKKITILPISNSEENKVEIRVWSIDPNTDRDDLAFPLSACGTGVGQVLAILYVVITSEEPRTIIIDEPQSFLHPGAARKLIEILQDFPQHQYFISTHSPSIISAANPSTITLLQYENSEANPCSMSSDDTAKTRSLLNEVGVHLSDVFGSDNILWVEGPTEEICFPLILKEIAKLHLRGTQILAIKNTGDLEGKKAHIIFDVYDKLSGGKVLLPPAVGFILDRENKTDKQIEDLKRRSRNEVHFIDRKMYENYLLCPEAIVEIANQHEGFSEHTLTALEVENWIENHKNNYLPKNFKEDENWINKVDGANLLAALFKEFSENRVTYKKTKHSVELTEWLVKHQPEQLLDLAELLTKILESNG